LSNLTTEQIAAIKGGAKIAQQWEIHIPLSAGGSLDYQYVFIHGVKEYGAMQRVIKAGSRKHVVWNKHVNAPIEAAAVRYSFEVDNSDGFFHTGAGNCWNYTGYYQADPTECAVMHKINIWDSTINSYQEVPSMRFFGKIISVEYVGTARHNGTVAPKTAVITCEQEGAWVALKRAFIKDDGDWERFDRPTLDTYTV
jgi:hypothetical protein